MGTFLDVLPDDVNNKIAKILYKDVEREDSDDIYTLRDSRKLHTLLRFAKLSDTHRRAVMTAMDHTIAAYIWRKETIKAWVMLFADMITKLDLTNSRLIEIPADLPVLSQLQIAGICAGSNELDAIRSSTKLTSLTVVIDNLQIWDAFVDTISVLQLKELNIFFDLSGVRIYSGNDLYEIPSGTQEKITAACPLVETISIRGNRIYLISSAIWSVITALPSLKKLEYQGEIPDEYVLFLRTLSEVVLFDMDNTDILHRLNKSVITGILRFRNLNEAHIQTLGSLDNLHKVAINPNKGAEGALIGAIRNVSMLALYWGFEKVWHTGHGEMAQDLCICRVYSEFYRPDPAVLLEIVESTPKLKTLKLERCVVSSATVEKLLQSLGDRLEYFAIAIDWQQEITTTRLTRILWAIARWCKKLRTLKLLEQDDRCLPIFATNVGKADCLRALSEVKRVLPGFLSDGNIRELIHDRFEYRRPGHLLLWDDIIRAS